MKVRIGLSEDVVTKVAGKLEVILANTMVIYTKSFNYHWNMEDSRFQALHAMIQTQYEGLATGIDEIAERIRMIGRKAPGTLKEFVALATIPEGNRDLSGDEMLADLAESHEAAIHGIRQAIEEIAAMGDPGTADMLTDAIRAHEKTAWLLRAHLKPYHG